MCHDSGYIRIIVIIIIIIIIYDFILLRSADSRRINALVRLGSSQNDTGVINVIQEGRFTHSALPIAAVSLRT